MLSLEAKPRSTGCGTHRKVPRLAEASATPDSSDSVFSESLAKVHSKELRL